MKLIKNKLYKVCDTNNCNGCILKYIYTDHKFFYFKKINPTWCSDIKNKITCKHYCGSGSNGSNVVYKQLSKLEGALYE